MMELHSNKFLKPQETLLLIRHLSEDLNTVVPKSLTTWNGRIKGVIAKVLLAHTKPKESWWKRLASILILVLTVSMGAEGLKALSEISGLEVNKGTYEYHEGGTVVKATGKHQSGVIWDIIWIWKDGSPVTPIVLHNPKMET